MDAAAAAAAAAVSNHDDDAPALSVQALDALREFLSEQHRQEEKVEEEEEERVSLVAEDWRLSQFWYEKETAETVAEEIIRLCEIIRRWEENVSVACLACPTLYVYLKKMKPDIKVQLLEYDRRFGQHGDDFTFYDYNHPEKLPLELKHAFQVVVADPPYLSQECLEKVSITISFLAQPREPYLLLLTGDVQRERAAELLNLHPCVFRPKHSSKLGNEFLLFTNYKPGDQLGGWE